MEQRQQKSPNGLDYDSKLEKFYTAIDEEVIAPKAARAAIDSSDDYDYEKEYFDALLSSVELEERQDILFLRKTWSTTFLVIVSLIFIFEIGIAIAVGLGALHYADEWFLRIFVLGGFAQLLVMPYTVTKFLFNTNSYLSRGKK